MLFLLLKFELSYAVIPLSVVIRLDPGILLNLWLSFGDFFYLCVCVWGEGVGELVYLISFMLCPLLKLLLSSSFFLSFKFD